MNNKKQGVIDVNLLLIFIIVFGMFYFHSFMGCQGRRCNLHDSVMIVKMLAESPSYIRSVLQSEFEKSIAMAMSTLETS